jgi:hypothetical protein
VLVNDPEQLVALYRELAEDFAGGFAHSAVVTEWLSPALEPVVGSERPPADDVHAADGTYVWRLGRLPDEGAALRHVTRPRVAGRVPIGRARLDYAYGQGTLMSGRVYLPIPVIEVTGGDAATATPVITSTPLPSPVPSRTPTPRHTATADPPRGDGTLFVPIARQAARAPAGTGSG